MWPFGKKKKEEENKPEEPINNTVEAKEGEEKKTEEPKTETSTENKPAEAPKTESANTEGKPPEPAKQEASGSEAKPAEAPKAETATPESKPTEAPKAEEKPADEKKPEDEKEVKPADANAIPGNKDQASGDGAPSSAQPTEVKDTQATAIKKDDAQIKDELIEEMGKKKPPVLMPILVCLIAIAVGVGGTSYIFTIKNDSEKESLKANISRLELQVKDLKRNKQETTQAGVSARAQVVGGPAVGLKNYSDKVLNVSFQYPSGWVVDAPLTKTSVLTIWSNKCNYDEICPTIIPKSQIKVDILKKKTSAKTVSKLADEDIFKNKCTEGKSSNITVGSETGKIVEFTCKSGIATNNFKSVYYLKSGYGYIFRINPYNTDLMSNLTNLLKTFKAS